jgi:hypothetical protein
MAYLKIKRTRVQGAIPTVNQIDTETLVHNEVDGLWFSKRILLDGTEQIICLGGGSVPPVQSHQRAHQIDEPLDHPSVPLAKRNKWLHTNAETGAIELVDLPEGLDGETPFIGPNGNWWIGETDTGVQAAGEDGDSAYLYIAYASDDEGTDFSLTPDAALKYIAVLTTDTEIPAPAAGNFTGLWVKYIGEDATAGALGHYCYIAWRDAPGDAFTLVPNLTAAYEAILITHEEIAKPVEADFNGFWRERLTTSIIHQVPAGGTINQVLAKKSADDWDTEWQTPSGGGASLLLDTSTLTFQGFTAMFTAGENLAPGDVCYMNAGKLYKADADAVATSFAFAVSVATTAADASGEFLLIGVIAGLTGLTVGAPVYLSTSSGAFTQTLVSGSNDVGQLLGLAISATHIYFKPELVQVELL